MASAKRGPAAVPRGAESRFENFASANYLSVCHPTHLLLVYIAVPKVAESAASCYTEAEVVPVIPPVSMDGHGCTDNKSCPDKALAPGPLLVMRIDLL